jgi:hypothetical protein
MLKHQFGTVIANEVAKIIGHLDIPSLAVNNGYILLMRIPIPRPLTAATLTMGALHIQPTRDG